MLWQLSISASIVPLLYKFLHSNLKVAAKELLQPWVGLQSSRVALHKIAGTNPWRSVSHQIRNCTNIVLVKCHNHVWLSFGGGAYLVSNLVECTWTLVKVVVDNAASKDQFKPAFSAFEKTTYVTCFYVPCDIFPNNNMIMFWKPTRLKTKNILGYNDVLKVWPHVIENNQAGTVVLEESPTTNFGNTPWHFRFSQHGRKPTPCSEMMMFRKFSQFDWKRAGTNVFEELPTASTSEMHHEVSKLANIWRQPITFLEMITLWKFSQFDWWTLNEKKFGGHRLAGSQIANICKWWHSEGFGNLPPPTLKMCVPIKCHEVRTEMARNLDFR